MCFVLATRYITAHINVPSTDAVNVRDHAFHRVLQEGICLAQVRVTWNRRSRRHNQLKPSAQHWPPRAVDAREAPVCNVCYFTHVPRPGIPDTSDWSQGCPGGRML
jgi:hypothetical protein